MPVVFEPTPTQMLVFSLTSFDRLISPGSFALVSRHPEAITSAITLAYERPYLIDDDPRMKLGTDLEEIKASYPTVISYLGDPLIFDDVLLGHANVKSRLEEERLLLKSLPEVGRILDIELVLKMMIEDGLYRTPTIEDYRNVRSSQQLFGSIVDALSPDNVVLETEERDKLTEIGQRLLITSRLFDAKTFEINSGSSKLKENQEDDFNSLLAQMAMISRLIRTLEGHNDSDSKEQLGNLKRDLANTFEATQNRHPNRRAELHKRYANFTGISDQGWVVHPGGPEFTKAEEIDFRRSGNNNY